MPESSIKDVVNKLRKESERYKLIDQLITHKQAAKEKKTVELKALAAQVEMDMKVIEIFKKVIEAVSMEGLKYVKDLVTRGLQTVFTDDIYVLDIEISDRGANKTVELFIEDSRGVRSEIANCGGGIQSVVSFIFQVYFILKMKLPRLLFLDEAFARLSSQYAEGMFEFILALKKELNFKVLWITHSTYFADKNVDKVYHINRGKVKEIK